MADVLPYDERCEELARVFLGDLLGATDDDARQLAAAIQTVAEAHCYEIETRETPHD